MNQEEFISWIKNNSQWIIDKLENLEDYKNNDDDLKAGDIILSSRRLSNSEDKGFQIALINSTNIYEDFEYVSYFMQTGIFGKGYPKPPHKKIILHDKVGGQPYKEMKSLYLLEMDLQNECVVGNISEIIKKPFLNWNQETPWKKSSSNQ